MYSFLKQLFIVKGTVRLKIMIIKLGYFKYDLRMNFL